MRTVRIQLDGQPTIADIANQLSDLPQAMQLEDVEDDQSANPALREIVLVFKDVAQ